MLKLLLILTAVISVSAIDLLAQHVEIRRNIIESYMNGSPKELFKVFHYIYSKPYTLNSESAIEKYNVFKSNLNYIKEHNAKNLSWQLEINFFADMTLEQTKSYMGVLQVSELPKNKEQLKQLFKEKNFDIFDKLVDSQEKPTSDKRPKLNIIEGNGYFDLFADNDDDDPLPPKANDKDDDDPVPPKGNDDDDPTPPKASSLDNIIYEAIDHGRYLNAPRNQGNCGSCWAFSAITAIEANSNIKNGGGANSLGHLSTQEVLDCNVNKWGCSGGWMNDAIKHVAKNGISSEANYSYTQAQGGCKLNVPRVKGLSFNSSQPIKGCAWLSWFENFSPCTKESFYLLLKEGPVSALVNVDNDFIFYKSGVIESNRAGCESYNHAIVAYGWGHRYENDKLREFINIRNSWGPEWGDKGDIKYFYDQKGSCFVTKLAFLPNLI